jgi:hypothetical protein
MLIPKADFSASELRHAPPNRWCKSGHIAPEKFARDGMGRPETPTRFFSVVSDQAPGINGTYCEPCLIVANALKRGEIQIVTIK